MYRARKPAKGVVFKLCAGSSFFRRVSFFYHLFVGLEKFPAFILLEQIFNIVRKRDMPIGVNY